MLASLTIQLAVAMLLSADPQSLPTLAPQVEGVRNSVVNVEVPARAPVTEGAQGAPGNDEFFHRYFGGGQGNGSPQGRSQVIQESVDGRGPQFLR